MTIDSAVQLSEGAGTEADAPDVACADPGSAEQRADRAGELRSIRMMHLLERIAEKFNEAGVPLMALNLTLQLGPHDRPMDDLDLLIKPEHVEQAFRLLEALGGLRGEPLVRDDFFPRFHYEMEYTVGRIYPVKIDLHVRPFRPLRYSRVVPPDAMWARACPVRMGRATILVPCREDMLIHLCAHLAIHGYGRRRWFEDIRQWVDAWRTSINWERFIETTAAWGLVLPVREAMTRVERQSGPVFPADVLQRLHDRRVGWRDRLALHEAPRDAGHPAAHVAVNVLCTPGWRFVLGYLWSVAFPDRVHMADWYGRGHKGWLVCAHALRLVWPIVGRIGLLHRWLTRIETRESSIHGIGVFATKAIRAGQVIRCYHGKPVDHHGPYTGCCQTRDGQTQRYEITGRLRYLNHSCNPNAAVRGFRLVALRPIAAGGEIMIDYTNGTCSCRQEMHGVGGASPEEKVADAA